MNGQSDYTNKQMLRSLNGLPQGHQQRYNPILWLMHFYQDATNLMIPLINWHLLLLHQSVAAQPP
jgi:hypothetical protein